MQWIGYFHEGKPGFGSLADGKIEAYDGDIFGEAVKAGHVIDLNAVQIGMPCKPSKMIGLWNNSHAVAASQGLQVPTEPLYFVKPPNCYAAHDEVIDLPGSVGRVIYEAELGIVIGKKCKDVSVDEAADAIFGYTCVNDLTAISLLQAEAGFTHWCRAKGLDGFGPFGPVIETELNPENLQICTRINGRERQRYSTNDLILKPNEIVSLVSRATTLLPGDIIACGTSLGVGPVPKNGNVEVEIEGIGVLRTHFRASGSGEAV